MYSVGKLISSVLLCSLLPFTLGSPLLSRDSSNYLIDFHSHVNPPWFANLSKQYLDPRAAVSVLNPAWSVDAHMAYMNAAGINHSVISFSTPGPNALPGNVTFATNVARMANE